MRTFVISDIHGGFLPFKEILSAVNFDFDNDELICNGDVCDGWPEVKECFELLSKIKNLIYIWGNHDVWAYNYYSTTRYHEDQDDAELSIWELDYIEGQNAMDRWEFDSWYKQGGRGTINSFGKTKMSIEASRILKQAKNYYIDNKNRLFVHGGFDLNISIDKQSRDLLTWDRDLPTIANHKMIMHEKHGHKNKISNYDEIFIGHTPTIIYHKSVPIHNCELWMIDTGASYSGPVTIMNVDTHEFWQSKPACEYYPGIKARG